MNDVNAKGENMENTQANPADTYDNYRCDTCEDLPVFDDFEEVREHLRNVHGLVTDYPYTWESEINLDGLEFYRGGATLIVQGVHIGHAWGGRRADDDLYRWA